MALQTEDIQELLKQAQKKAKGSKDQKWDDVLKNLWSHLLGGLDEIDDQLLCSTCFYTVLKLTDNQEHYLKKILTILNENLSEEKANNDTTVVAVSLMYGLLQSPYLTKDTNELPMIIKDVLELTLTLLIKLAYEYSRFTFIVFKTLSCLKKVCNTIFQDSLLCFDNVRKLLNLVNHNWENPITGVRELNRTIFRTLLLVVEPETRTHVIEQVNSFYWNKAKFLMLTEIIELSPGNIVNLVNDYNWTRGLMDSLKKPGLVSAGTDMYFAILKKLNSEQQWIEIFLTQILTVIHGTHRKENENLQNYWYLTTFKTFPSLALLLKDNVEKRIDTLDEVLYSYLALVSKANKLGLIKKDWLEGGDNLLTMTVTKALDHCDTAIRILAFDILCLSQGRYVAIEMRGQLITEFLENNVNSDCTVLRINMIASFKLFFKHYSIYLKSCPHIENHQIEFVHNIYKFISKSFKLDGNYQRKIATLKVCDVYLNNINELRLVKKWFSIDKNNEILPDVFKRDYLDHLLHLLEDPAEDIRENAKQLLISYHIDMISSTLLDTLISRGLKCMESKFFYEITCSQTMMKLITYVLCKRDVQSSKFKKVEELFHFVNGQFKQEIQCQRDIVESIKNGRQLHSFIGILQVILEVCQKEHYSIDISSDTITALMGALEGISNQFVWEQETATSSDFSKMSEMVQAMIKKSSSNNTEQNDTSKISGLEQIVLNCLWLNVKASCDLALFMIKFQSDNMSVCQRSLLLITHVLETSRHKGAIEAAGASLGQAIQHLTSLREDSLNSELPFQLLKCKLQELILETNKMASITRRGAGLSIMVHRIVSGDMKKGRPLFHYFMRNILELCMKTEDYPENSSNTDVDNQKDLPKAIYIHFLTRIVTDSSLACHGMYYSTELAELAFDNLTSPHWQIRNAALQLYGALVPKLIGQKKSSGAGDETIATVACDEFITHSPKLWMFMKEQIKSNNHEDLLLAHSNLVPILNILGNIAKRYHFLGKFSDGNEFDNDFLQSLVLLLGSSILKVRRLAAQTIYNIYTCQTVCNLILEYDIDSENLLHGILMLLKHFAIELSDYQEISDKLKLKFHEKLNDKKHSYCCYTLYENIFDLEINVKTVEDTFVEVDTNKYLPGVDDWANNRLERLVQHISLTDIPCVLDIVLKRRDFEEKCEYLLPLLENNHSKTNDKVFISIAQILLKFSHKFSSSIIWKMLYKISQKVDLQDHIDTEGILKTFFTLNNYFKIRHIIPFLIRTNTNSMNSTDIALLAKIVYSLSDSEVDVDMRHVAAEANNELAFLFSKLNHSAKVYAVKTAITLLQDEDVDVRNTSVLFFSNVLLTTTFQPYITLKKMFEPQFYSIFSKTIGIEELSLHVSELIKSMNVIKTDDYNPFSNDLKNVYFEENLQQLLDELKFRNMEERF